MPDFAQLNDRIVILPELPTHPLPRLSLRDYLTAGVITREAAASSASEHHQHKLTPLLPAELHHEDTPLQYIKIS